MTEKIDLSQRVNALMQMAQSASAVFGPGQPPETWWDDEPPRLFEYQPGHNLVTVPRAGYGVLPFSVLRALAQTSKEIRLNIELIKRTIRGMEWDVVPRGKLVEIGGVKYQIDASETRKFFERPNGVDDFDAWVNQLLETLLTIDAVTIYPDMDGERLISLDLVDGATIRPLLDLRGRIPRPPVPAYLQVLYGMPTTHYSSDRLIYAPLNAKTHTPYGESPIEWALMAINTAIRHDAVRLGWFTEGNIPGVLISVSPEWTPEQLQTFTEYFDALAKGDIQRASKILFVPGNGAQSIFQPQQSDADKIEVDKWLMQVICWAFGNNPAEFGLVPSAGLGGAGYVAGMENAQYRSMIGPITGYLKSLFDRIIHDYMRQPALEFKWLGLEPPEDELRRAQIDQVYLSMGVYSPAYVQQRLGVPPEYRDQPARQGQDIASFLPFLQRAAKADLDDWREKARREFKKGERFSIFRSDVIPERIYGQVAAGLQRADSLEAIDAVFEKARNLLSHTEYFDIFPVQEVGEFEPFRYP